MKRDNKNRNRKKLTKEPKFRLRSNYKKGLNLEEGC